MSTCVSRATWWTPSRTARPHGYERCWTMSTACWTRVDVAQWWLLTQFADVFSELLERGAQAFVVGGDFNRVQHEGHAVDLLLQARPLLVAEGLRLIHRLNRTELREIERSKKSVAVATVHKQQFRNSPNGATGEGVPALPHVPRVHDLEWQTGRHGGSVLSWRRPPDPWCHTAPVRLAAVLSGCGFCRTAAGPINNG